MHHAYGAYIYDTRWRLHTAVISALATALIAASLRLLRKHVNDGIGVVASWTFIALTFVVPLLGFGVFEGVYNHALKNALYLCTRRQFLWLVCIRRQPTRCPMTHSSRKRA